MKPDLKYNCSFWALTYTWCSNVLLAPPIKHAIRELYLGGDPAAGSPTATLLRLFPPHET